MSAAHVLVIEDEHAIRRGVADALRTCGYQVTEAADGAHGLEEGVKPNVDLILLDLLLPRRDGMSVLAEVRRRRPTVPVIILTARGSENDRVRGLTMGADDYVVKPFSARELLARVEALLRRSGGRASDIKGARLGRAIIDFQRREIRWSERERGELSEMEAAILSFLVFHRTRAVTRDELLSQVWGISPQGLETRTVDMHVVRLRNKLRDPARRKSVEAILTVRSQGYMASPDLTPLERLPARQAERVG
jgi:DNA-binding response OmpR family regulator